MTPIALPDPAESCHQPPGVFVPVVDRARCEGKDECVRVCPYDVLEIRKVVDHEKAGLGRFARFKLFVHGGEQAFAIRADQCRACGRCVAACPEHAITLRRAR